MPRPTRCRRPGRARPVTSTQTTGDSGDATTAIDESTGEPIDPPDPPPPTCVDPADLPAWRQELAVGEWALLASAKITEVTPDVQPGGGYYGRIDAWTGFGADTVNSTLYLGGVGGHGDYAGNEMYTLDLRAAEPQWVIEMQPSPASAYTVDEPYYLDGRPSPTHTYYGAWFSEQRGKFYRFPTAATWGTGNGATRHIDSWDPASKQWDPAGTNPDMGVSPTYEMPAAKHALTGEIYQVQFDNHLYRWDPATNMVTDLGEVTGGKQSFYDLYASASVVDAVGERLIFFFDEANPGSARVYDIVAETFSSAPLVGPGAAAVASQQAMAWFDVCAGVILVKTEIGGDVWRVDPDTLEATPFAVRGPTPPDPLNGVHTLFQYLPALGGYAYQPTHAAGMYFLATQ
jgi:hypothetical protein